LAAGVTGNGVNPSGDSDVLATRGHGPRGSITFELRPAPPFRLDLTVWALRRRHRNRVDRWDGRYRRALPVRGRALTVQVEQQGDLDHPVLTVSILTPEKCTEKDLFSVKDQLVQILGIDVDLQGFYDLADADRRVRAVKDRFLGVRPPRFSTLFEALASAIANQQLSLGVRIELLNRLTERFGTRPLDGQGLASFPEPEAIFAAPLEDLRGLGFSMRKAEYLVNSAYAIASGAIDLAPLESADRARATELLMGLYGIGRWSAEYVLLRGLGRTDVFPADDVGARNKLQRFMDLAHPPSRDEIVALLAPWDPYAGMIYFHLLLLGLDERGELEI
jgi:DNA-3-methyladenine glycosylase II